MLFLLKCGASIDVCAPKGPSLVEYVLTRSSLEMARAVIAAGANLNARVNGSPILFSANTHIIMECITAGADPFMRSPTGCSLLWPALFDQCLLQTLLDLGLDVNHQDHEGNTVLHYLMKHHNPFSVLRRAISYPQVPFLLEQGADPSIRNKLGQTPVELSMANNLPAFTYKPKKLL